MPLNAPDPIQLPDHVWHDPAVLDLCRTRDANGLLRLAKKYGTSNDRIGYWTGIDAGEISKRLTGKMTSRPIATLDRWTRIADAFNMPDHARVLVGIAPACLQSDRPIYARPPRTDRQVPASTSEGFGDGVWVRLSELSQDESALIAIAASQSCEHAGLSGASVVDATTVESLHEEVERLARAFLYTPPLHLFARMVRTRDLTYRLLDHTHKPQQVADLYLVAGQLCGLMSSASFDLGYLDAASEQSRAAFSYGEIIGHGGLRAWARGMQAIVALWSGFPQEAVEIARSGHTYVSEGSPLVRLYSIEARAWSMLGNHDAVVARVQAAGELRAQDTGTDELHDLIGGEFGFDTARQARCHGSAFLQLGDAEQAVQATKQAVGLYGAQPAERRWMVLEAEAYADLAAAYLMHRTLDGAREALVPAFSVPPERRIVGLTQRLGRVRGLLAQRPYQGSSDALALGRQIEAFEADSMVRALPARMMR